MNILPIKRALLSLSDKTGIIEFANNLSKLGVEILSTGGTSRLLSEAGIKHKTVEEITGLPEMLDGRIKTLHPKIHGGILGRRDKHIVEMIKHDIPSIDLVVVNFYPFSKVMGDKNVKWDVVIEQIDIGGPAMVRAAAKNFKWVAVVVDPYDYSTIFHHLHEEGGLTVELRKKLAEKAFALTATYDDMIYRYFLNERQVNVESSEPLDYLDLRLKKFIELRYGENPHQKANAYQIEMNPALAQQNRTHRSGVLSAAQYQGKMLSYNNILDADAALACVSEFQEPACVIVKHANPCGVAVSSDLELAFMRAYQADQTAAFGGIVAFNQICTKQLAESISRIFVEVIVAPGYAEEALTLHATKPNLRVLEMPLQKNSPWEMRFITGGVLVQERDTQVISIDDLKIVTTAKPTQEAFNSMLFAWRVVKHIKSNAILIVKDHATVGIGAGQVSRIDAVEIAIRKAGNQTKDAVLASDAFFPFRDSIDCIAKTGIRAIIQPGGSVRDNEIIAACDQHGIAMVFTGKRCFRH